MTSLGNDLSALTAERPSYLAIGHLQMVDIYYCARQVQRELYCLWHLGRQLTWSINWTSYSYNIFPRDSQRPTPRFESNGAGGHGLTLTEHELRSGVGDDVLRNVDILRTRTTAHELEVVVDNQERQ